MPRPLLIHVTLQTFVSALLLAVAPGVRATALDYDSIWKCDADKFHWYCDIRDEIPAKEPVPPTAEPEKKPAPKPPPKHISELKTAEEIRKELDRLKDIATVDATEANVRAYLDAQEFVARKGAIFADVAQRVVWKTPALDYSLRNPTNNYAVSYHRDLKEKDKRRTLADLAKENGMLFFFRSDCPYCHALAPTLKRLEREHGLEIIPISLDGAGIPGFENPQRDVLAAQRLGVTTVPAMFLGSKTSGDIQPIGFGVISQSEIVDRIYTITQTQPGDKY